MTTDLDLLYLYDGDMSWLGRSVPRFDANLNIAVKGGINGLKNVFGQLLSQNKTFKRVVFDTHGYKGMIFFGDEKGNKQIDVGKLSEFNGYDALFPNYTRMYFDGCNVADDDEGWKFLETAGKIFLPRGGGLTFGWTSKGFAVGSNLISILSGPVFTLTHAGKVWHPWGDARYVWITPGGFPAQRYTDSGWF
jgi:hypothetical protein